MTKFTDRLEHDLEQIADRATPSSNAWQAIQTRMAEPVATETREIVMLTDERERVENVAEGRRRNWIAVAAGLAVALVAAGIIIGNQGPDEVDVTDQPNTETTVESVGSTTTTEPEQEVTELLPGFTLSPGSVHTDVLGMDMQLDVIEQARGSFVRPGEFQLVDQESETRFVLVARIGGWPTLEESSDPSLDHQGSIDPADVDGWIADNHMIATRRDDTTIDGRPAMVYDLRTDAEVEGSLSEEGKLNLVYTVAEPSFDPAQVTPFGRVIVPDMSLRLWFIEVDGFAPIAIFAAEAPGPPDSPDISAGWIDEFENSILPTIVIGPDGPSQSRS